MLKEEIHESGQAGTQHYLVEKIGIMLGLLLVYEAVLCDGQRIQLDMLEHLVRKVVGQEVGGDLLVAHGFPEEGVVFFVDLAHEER
jgi:hypothetical protein